MAPLFKAMLVTSLSFALVGCSSGSNSQQVPPEQTEIDQLKDENEELRERLEAAIDNLETAESKIEKLESEINAAKDKPEIESAHVDIVPPQLALKELLIGEWFYQDFHEEEVNSWIQSLVFNADGTGKIVRTFYLPANLNVDSYSTSDTSGEVTLGFSWSINGNVVSTVYDGGGGSADYTFSSEQEQLHVKSEGGKEVTSELLYARKKPSVPNGYVERIALIKDIQAQESALKRRFLGNWYFDVLVWTFNDDGTGIIDIPEVGEQPATKRSFSYQVTGDLSDSDILMTIDWSDAETSYYHTTIDEYGSIYFRGAGNSDYIKLNRSFDVNNCPISAKGIASGMSVFTGSIFNDILAGG